MEGGGKRRTHPDHRSCDDKVRGLRPGARRRERMRGPARRRGACALGRERLRRPGGRFLFAHTSCRSFIMETGVEEPGRSR